MSRRIMVTGATGFLGSRLVQRLCQRGDQVVAVSRNASRARQLLGKDVECFEWDHLTQPFPEAALVGVSAVFHLMGENIGAGRWTQAKKTALRNSRIDSTRLLVEALPESVTDFLCASAIGIYPGQGDKVWEETSELPDPNAFMSQLCWDWEQEAMRSATTTRRHVSLRIGLVLGSSGMLAPLVPLYRFGLGGPIGDGRQYVPWIHIDDSLDAFLHVQEHDELAGAVNIVGPDPVPLNDFSQTLAKVLHRPHLLRVPAFAMRLVLGEAAALILSSYNVVPTRLTQSGYTFGYSNHQDALEAVVRNDY